MSPQRQTIGQTDRDLDVEGHALAFNDNETIVRDDVEGHALAFNDNETVESDPDVEGHGMNLGNDNETVVVDEGTRKP